MHKSYQPSGDYLLIKLDKSVEDITAEEGKSPSGNIVIPAAVAEGAVAKLPVLGTVVAAGPDAALGKHPEAPQITPGQRVDFYLFRSFPRIIEGIHYVQMNANQILGIVGTPKMEVSVAAVEGDPIRN